jgi:hypothetical protein
MLMWLLRAVRYFKLKRAMRLRKKLLKANERWRQGYIYGCQELLKGTEPERLKFINDHSDPLIYGIDDAVRDWIAQEPKL